MNLFKDFVFYVEMKRVYLAGPVKGLDYSEPTNFFGVGSLNSKPINSRKIKLVYYI